MSIVDESADQFEIIAETIADFQRKVFGATWPRDIDALAQQYAVLTSRECFELINETNFKPHKPIHKIDRDKVQEESVDVLIYAIALGMSVYDGDVQALLHGIKNKILVNQERMAAL